MWEVFNMGCGMCVMVPSEHAGDATALLGRHHPGTALIGRVTESQGEVALPGAGLRLTPGDSR
jgi:phosphoribosylaminoimidazole (AIR) synthetase